MEKDYYKILGLNESDKSLSEEDFLKKLKKNYRKLTLLYHPDKQNGKSESEKKEAEDKFKECVEAYEVLSDKDKKYKYDNFGTVDGNFTNSSMDDILKEFAKHGGFNFDGFNPFGGNPFGGFGFSQGEKELKGSDIVLRVTLSLDEVYNHSNKTVYYNRNKPCSHCNGKGYEDGGGIEKCPTCNGTGMVTHIERNGYSIYQTNSVCPTCNGSGNKIKNPCSHCNGSGLDRVKEKFSFYIPSGVTNGTRMNVNGMGNYPENGKGKNGNLILVFKIADNGKYEIDEMSPYDLYMLREIPILDCITGKEDTIDHIDGKKYKYNISPNCENGTIIRLRNKGLMKQNGTYGDLKIVIKHKFPNEISVKELKLINKLKESKNFK